MLTSDQINHIKIIKYSGRFSDYKKEYFEYTNVLKVFQDFVTNYMPLRNMVSNYFDDKILDKIKLYVKFIEKKSFFSFDLCYEIKLVDYKYFMDAFDQKQYKKVEKLPSVLKYALIEGYNSAIKINQHEKRPDVDVIKPTYSDSEIAEFKTSLFELFPELNKKEEKKIDKGEFVTEDEGIDKGEFITED